MLKLFTSRNTLTGYYLARMAQIGQLEKVAACDINALVAKNVSTSACLHHISKCNKYAPLQLRIQNEYSTDVSTNAENKVPENLTASIRSPQPPSESESTDQNSPICTDENAEFKLDKLFKTIELEILAYEPSILDSYQWFVITAASHLNINVGKCWSPLKSDKLRFSLLKSAFVHKKHQVQYEVRTYHRFITLNKLTESTADTFLEYIQRNLPEGVGLKVTKVEVKPLPESLSK